MHCGHRRVLSGGWFNLPSSVICASALPTPSLASPKSRAGLSWGRGPAASDPGHPAGRGDGDDPTGDPIDAPTAQQVGLVSRIVPAEALLATALQIARRIASHAPLAIKAVKEVAYAALDETLEQSLRFGGALRWIIGQRGCA